MKFVVKNTRFLFVFVLPVYFFIVQNTIKNKHTHIFANGIVVTHSHPLSDGEPVKDHGHTKSEICFFHQVNIGYFSHTPELKLELFIPFVQTDYFISNERNYDDWLIFHSSQRAPPLKSIFFNRQIGFI